MNVKYMSVQISYGELPDIPGLVFNIFNDICAPAFKFGVGQVNVFCKDPMNIWLDSFAGLGKKYSDVFPPYCTYIYRVLSIICQTLKPPYNKAGPFQHPQQGAEVPLVLFLFCP
jgi:hypothetical protein